MGVELDRGDWSAWHPGQSIPGTQSRKYKKKLYVGIVRYYTYKVTTISRNERWYLNKTVLQQLMFTSCRRPHLPHRVERSFQRKNTNADTLNTRKITIKAIISTVKSASTMSSSSRVVIGDLKWQYTCKHMTIYLTQWNAPFKSTKNIRPLKFLYILCILHTSNNWKNNRISKTI